MYRGFKLPALVLPKKIDERYNYYYIKGKKLYQAYQKTTTDILSKYITPRGTINASAMQENWFPNLDVDIFLSHSHQDEDDMIAFAGYIKEKTGLNAFIDSCIWGNCNDLLKIIDDNYCVRGEYYDYNERNKSTSHVHMMLSAALTMMIDRAECLFFIDTPNSISSSDTIQRSYSPWIYYEINTSKYIRKHSPVRHREFQKAHINETRMMSVNPPLEYELEMGHLSTLGSLSFKLWILNTEDTLENDNHPLDNLYDRVDIQ